MHFFAEGMRGAIYSSIESSARFKDKQVMSARTGFLLLAMALGGCSNAVGAPTGSGGASSAPSQGGSNSSPAGGTSASIGGATSGTPSDLPMPWWHHLTGERTLNARKYGWTLKQVESNLDTLQGQGYQILNLDWPVQSGPVAIFGGFCASDYGHVDPNLGSDQDWLDLVAAVHARRMAIISWFNPSYFWTESPLFKQAELDVAMFGVERDKQPASSPARFFRWMSNDPGGTVEKPGPNGLGNQFTGKWVHDPDANGAYYMSVWSGEPTGDQSSPEWAAKLKSIINYWLSTGMDGFVFDAPTGYLVGDEPLFQETQLRASTTLALINDTVHATPNHFSIGEDPKSPGGIDAWGFDATECQLWRQDPTQKPWISAVATHDASGLEGWLTERDAKVQRGGVNYVPIDVASYSSTAEALLSIAIVAGTGNMWVVKAVGNSQFGDLTSWPSDPASGAALAAIGNAVRNSAALDLTGSRLVLTTSDGAYGAIRTSPDGKSGALIVFNLTNSAQQVTLDLSTAHLTLPLVPTDMLQSGSPPPTIMTSSYVLPLPALGYAFLNLGTMP